MSISKCNSLSTSQYKYHIVKCYYIVTLAKISAFAGVVSK